MRFFIVSKEIAVYCVFLLREGKKEKKKNARSDKAIPSGSEIGCWEMTDDPD